MNKLIIKSGALIVVGLMFLTVFSGMADARPPPTYRIYGYVTDSSTGQALGGATVSVGGVTTTTGSDGYYSVSGLDPGSFSVYAYKTGYYTSTPSTVTISSSSVQKNIALNPQQKTVSGYVTTNGGSPVVGALVTIEGTSFSATTNSNGYYSLGYVGLSGNYYERVSKVGYKDVVTRQYLGSSSITVNVQMEAQADTAQFDQYLYDTTDTVVIKYQHGTTSNMYLWVVDSMGRIVPAKFSNGNTHYAVEPVPYTGAAFDYLYIDLDYAIFDVGGWRVHYVTSSGIYNSYCYLSDTVNGPAPADFVLSVDGMTNSPMLPDGSTNYDMTFRYFHTSNEAVSLRMITYGTSSSFPYYGAYAVPNTVVNCVSTDLMTPVEYHVQFNSNTVRDYWSAQGVVTTPDTYIGIELYYTSTGQTIDTLLWGEWPWGP
jgi:hypothetical protein